jgi:hypothetical protein
MTYKLFLKFYLLKKNYNKIIMSTKNNLIILNSSAKWHGAQIYLFIWSD